MNDEKEIEHESFGMLEVSRVQGDIDLFGVDYPTGHFITMRLYEGVLIERSGTNWFHARKIISEIRMSDVQFATMITGMNLGGGHPVTIAYRTEGPMREMGKPPKMDSPSEKAKGTIKKSVKETSARLDRAFARLEEALGPGSVSKATLKEIRDEVYQARMELQQNLPFYVEQGEAAIEKAADRAGQEIDAHLSFAAQRLGMLALGKQMIENGEGGLYIPMGPAGDQKLIGSDDKGEVEV